MTDQIKNWLQQAAEDTIFCWSCRGLDLPLTLRIADQSWTLHLCEEPLFLDTHGGGITLEAPMALWAEVLRADPAPGLHSFGALIRNEQGPAVTGSPVALAQALAALERLIELARPAPTPYTGFNFLHDVSNVTSRHRVVALPDGTFARLHYMEAGQGTPVVFLHTAGADARQFLHQLADTKLQKNHRLLAFDMPWHGLSSGADNVETTAQYKLTEARYLQWVVAFIDEIVQEPVILVGCSMGASMALTVAAQRPDLLRGVVALEAPLISPGRKSELLTDARIADSQHNPAYVRAMLGPGCPQKQRDEACAIYAQARPGVYMGDLGYYSEEYDGKRLAPALRTCGVPIELLTGSYDYSASPANTRQLLNEIGGSTATFHEMDGLGHFPMIEDPDRFRPHFCAALARIEERRP
ncbi:Pimeloyl-ACP methyl ester carboxylesterase [Sulfitobacter brevis]|uniref:Pimeloyl-ACP methyl ester carboxylesterase n=1 Tax=Sulfitobacter brevis TaxID=74348 RepID=A0A1I1WM51_9RHOB|nr:alpha/beta hydrolase [Sulfitobacter brevis]SFD96061.1 Pimeloyl-ACP methyl ester carboxylesterase [Sulfitobacter brevis]